MSKSERNMLELLARVEGPPSDLSQLGVTRRRLASEVATPGTPAAEAPQMDEDEALMNYLRLYEKVPMLNAPKDKGFVGQGFVEGTQYPFRLFGVGGEEIAEEDRPRTMGQQIEQGLGFFVGAGLAYIPYGLGASALLRGLGVTARMAPGVAQAMHRVLHGSISGAAFEAGSAEELSQVPVKGAIGAAFGGVAELAFLGASRWRGAKPTTRTSPVDENGVATTGTYVNSDLLNLERRMRPSTETGLEELRTFMAGLGDENAQAEYVAGKMATLFKPGGMMVIPGVENGDAIASLLRKNYPDLQIFSARNRKELLVTDNAGVYKDYGADLTLQEIQGLWNEGKLNLDVKKLVQLVKTKSGNNEGFPITHKATSNWGEAYPLDKNNQWRINMSKDLQKPGNELKYFSTLIHEWTHQLTRYGVMTRSGVTAPGASAVLAKPNSSVIAKIANIFPNRTNAGHHPLGSAEWRGLIYQKELVDMTPYEREWLSASYWTRHFKGDTTATDNTFEGWWDAIKGGGSSSGRGYYGSDTELLARMVEIMVWSPKKALEIAPNAAKDMVEWITKSYPAMEMALSRTELKLVGSLIKSNWAKEMGELVFYNADNLKLTRRQQIQWIQDGGFAGMPGRLKNGALVEWEKLQADGKLRVRLAGNKQRVTDVVDLNDFVRTEISQLAEADEALKAKLRASMQKKPEWLGFSYLTEGVVAPDQPPQRYVQRAVVKLGNLEELPFAQQVKVGGRDVTLSPWAGYYKANKEAIDNWVKQNPQLDLRTISLKGQVQAYLENTSSKDGFLVYNGNNRTGGYEVFLFPGKAENAIVLGDQFAEGLWQARGKGLDLVQKKEGALPTRIQPGFQATLESMLRAEGVSTREIDHLFRVAEREMVKDMRTWLGAEGKLTLESSERELASALSRVGKGLEMEGGEDMAASAANVLVEQDAEGAWRVMSRERAEMARFDRKEQAIDFVGQLGDDAGEALDATSSLPTAVTALGPKGGKPPRPQAQLFSDAPFTAGRFSKLVASMNVMAPWFTSMGSFARSVEKLGLGPASREVYEPVQRILEQLDRRMFQDKYEELGGSFASVLERVKRMSTKLTKEENEDVVRYLEALSQEEIAEAGGYMTRAMNPEELELSKWIRAKGLQSDVHRLQGLNRMIEGVLENKSQFLKRYGPLIQDPKVDESVKQMIVTIAREMDNLPSDKTGLMEFLALPLEQRQFIGHLDAAASRKLDDFSIDAVLRHTKAPKLKPGFKDAQEMYAKERGMKQIQMDMATELEQLFKVSFATGGINPKRYLRGYWPHVRESAKWGIMPDDPFMKKHVPDAVEWFSEKVKTGELDLYNMDPVIGSFKHVRAMLVKQEFNPELPSIMAAIRGIGLREPRVGRVLTEMVDEALGRPHSSFDQIGRAIQSAARAMGGEFDPRTVARFVNTMTGLGYGATIPFRPALIMRNYFQMVQHVPPVVGWSSFKSGLEMALTKEGYQAAVKAGAVLQQFAPIHAADDVFSIGAERMGKGLSPIIKQMGERWESVVNKGLDWYRSGDDVGRAVAFHAMRNRISKHIDDLHMGRIDYETFKVRSKIKMLDEVMENAFDDLWLTGNTEGAMNYAGKQLADLTHFMYGRVNHPAGWGSIYGRLFGQFGTYPVQFKDYLLMGMSRGTTVDKVEFAASLAATNVGIVGAGAAVGYNLWSWATLPSLTYTGGPYADVLMNMVQSMSGSDIEQSLANRNLKMLFPGIEDPRSIFVPGSYFVGDLVDAWRDGEVGRALGLRKLNEDGGNALQQIFSR